MSTSESTNAIKMINSVIQIKKLTFNSIWTSKISQDDLYSIKPLENSNENLILINIVFNSILVFSKKINEKLLLLSNSDLNNDIALKYIHEVILYSQSLVSKIKNFLEIKNKTFKLNKENLYEIKTLKDQVNLFNIQGGSSFISDLYDFLSEFYDDLVKHLSV